MPQSFATFTEHQAVAEPGQLVGACMLGGKHPLGDTRGNILGSNEQALRETLRLDGECAVVVDDLPRRCDLGLVGGHGDAGLQCSGPIRLDHFGKERVAEDDVAVGTNHRNRAGQVVQGNECDVRNAGRPRRKAALIAFLAGVAVRRHEGVTMT